LDKQSSHLGRREFQSAAATGGVGLTLEPAAGLSLPLIETYGIVTVG
jgi:hypothetical protein